MKVCNITMLVISLSLTACKGSSENNESSPIIGSWATQACAQLTDNNGAPINVWVKGYYDFTVNGSISFYREGYTDSNCTTEHQNFIPGSFSVVTFKDNGATTLQEGIQGHKIFINFMHLSPNVSSNGFYTINNNTLCFSDTFVLEANRFGINQPDISDIDFNNCLVKY